MCILAVFEGYRVVNFVPGTSLTVKPCHPYDLAPAASQYMLYWLAMRQEETGMDGTNTVVAIMYDFDKTLTTKDMQEIGRAHV